MSRSVWLPKTREDKMAHCSVNNTIAVSVRECQNTTICPLLIKGLFLFVSLISSKIYRISL